MHLKRWYAVHTYAQHEKKVCACLASRGVDHYLPTYLDVKRWKNRQTVELERPLFPGYVFVRINCGERGRVFVPGIATLVSFGGRPLPIPDQDIDLIQNRLEGLRAEPHPWVRCGDRVRVTTGALAGVEGFVVQKKSSSRIVILMGMIQRAISVEIDAGALEVLSERDVPLSSFMPEPASMNTRTPGF